MLTLICLKFSNQEYELYNNNDIPNEQSFHNTSCQSSSNCNSRGYNESYFESNQSYYSELELDTQLDNQCESSQSFANYSQTNSEQDVVNNYTN